MGRDNEEEDQQQQRRASVASAASKSSQGSNVSASPLSSQMERESRPSTGAEESVEAGTGHEGDKPTSSDSGLLPRVLNYIFSQINRKNSTNEGPTTVTYNCRCSFLEIYNERIFDLLNTSSSDLSIREDSKNGVYVQDLKQMSVSTAEEALEVMNQGAKNRHIASTNMNRESSRSHSLFSLMLEVKESTKGLTKTKYARFNLIDLAGSERQKSTNASGLRLKEATNINKSLSALGNVISSLVENNKGKRRHIAYRDSKLTFLLKDSLGGNSRTFMIATLSPSIDSRSESLSTLKFAARVKLVRNDARINEATSGSVVQLQGELKRLKARLQEREAEISRLQVRPPPAPNAPSKGTIETIERETTTMLNEFNLNKTNLIEGIIKKLTELNVDEDLRDTAETKLYEIGTTVDHIGFLRTDKEAWVIQTLSSVAPSLASVFKSMHGRLNTLQAIICGLVLYLYSVMNEKDVDYFSDVSMEKLGNVHLPLIFGRELLHAYGQYHSGNVETNETSQSLVMGATERIEKLERNAKQHESEKSKLRELLSEEQSKNESLKSELQDLEEQAANWQEKAREQESKCSELENKNHNISVEKDNAYREKNSAKFELANLESDVDGLEKDCSDLREKNQQLQHELDERTKELKDTEKDKVSKISELESKVNTLEGDLAAKNENYNQIVKEKEDLQEQIATLQNESDKESRQRQELSSKLEAYSADVLKAQDIVRAADTSQESQFQVFSEKVDDSLKTLEGRIHTAMSQLQAKEKSISSLNHALTEKNERIDSLTTERSQLEERVQQLQEISDRNARELSQKSENSSELQKQFDELNERYEEVSSNLAAEQQRNKSLEVSLEEARKQADSAVEKIRSLEDASNQKEEELNASKAKIDHLSQSVDKLERELKEKQDELEATESGSSEKDLKVRNLEEELEDAKNRTSETENELKNMQDALEEKKSKIQDLEQEVEEKCQEISSRQETVGELEGRISTLETEKSKLQENIDNLNEQLEEKTWKVEEFQNEFSQIRTELDESQRRTKDLEEKNTINTEKLTELKKSLEESEQALEETRSSKKTAEQDAMEQKEKIALLEQQRDETTNRLKEVQGISEEKKQELEALQSSLQQSQSEHSRAVEGLREEKQSLEEQLNSLEQSQAELQESLKDKDEKISSLESSLSKVQEESKKKDEMYGREKSDLEAKVYERDQHIDGLSKSFEEKQKMFQEAYNTWENQKNELENQVASLHKEIQQYEQQLQEERSRQKEREQNFQNQIESITSELNIANCQLQEARSVREGLEKQVEEVKHENSSLSEKLSSVVTYNERSSLEREEYHGKLQVLEEQYESQLRDMEETKQNLDIAHVEIDRLRERTRIFELVSNAMKNGSNDSDFQSEQLNDSVANELWECIQKQEEKLQNARDTIEQLNNDNVNAFREQDKIKEEYERQCEELKQFRCEEKEAHDATKAELAETKNQNYELQQQLDELKSSETQLKSELNAKAKTADQLETKDKRYDGLVQHLEKKNMQKANEINSLKKELANVKSALEDAEHRLNSEQAQNNTTRKPASGQSQYENYAAMFTGLLEEISEYVSTLEDEFKLLKTPLQMKQRVKLIADLKKENARLSQKLSNYAVDTHKAATPDKSSGVAENLPCCDGLKDIITKAEKWLDKNDTVEMSSDSLAILGSVLQQAAPKTKNMLDAISNSGEIKGQYCKQLSQYLASRTTTDTTSSDRATCSQCSDARIVLHLLTNSHQSSDDSHSNDQEHDTAAKPKSRKRSATTSLSSSSKVSKGRSRSSLLSPQSQNKENHCEDSHMASSDNTGKDVPDVGL
eukprot:gb/GECG01014989.1/.p1 GENE.gb/GECG01014989.1/~~gb/GECG01014989.1/.p1  ORF type:complete len:1819 (+),score=405.10 gb/GECG01014989.1/:1-5457(+)